MAIQSANVIRASCDGCPAVVYAEAPAKPKGVTGSVQIVDGNGREINVQFFACQVQHVGAAVRNVAKSAKPVPATDFAPAMPDRYREEEIAAENAALTASFGEGEQ